MDHPIVTDLRMAREKGWERLRLLVGQWAYWRRNPRPPAEEADRLRPANEIQAEILELMKLLVPGQELEFVAYGEDSILPNAMYIKFSPHGLGAVQDKPWIGTPIVPPIAQPIEQPGAADDLDDPLDQLLNLGD